MKEMQPPNKMRVIKQLMRDYRKAVVILVIALMITSFIVIGLISNLISSLDIPDFTLSSLRIMDIEDNTIHANFSLEFTEALDQDLYISRIECKLVHEDDQEEKLILAKGETLNPITLNRETIIVTNLIIKFEATNLKNLFESLLNEKEIGIEGKIYTTLDFSFPFNYQAQELDTSLFPNITIKELHPIPPGTHLEIMAGSYNPHGISINLTEGGFQLINNEYGIFGNVSLTNVTMTPGNSTFNLLLQAGTEELTWLFEKTLNNGSIQAEITNLNAIVDISGEQINITMEKGPSFTWEGYEPGLQVTDLGNVKIEEEKISFDITIGVLGEPLWGYNITPGCGRPWAISFDFYHKLLDNKIHKVGNGSTNLTININRKELALVSIHINIFKTTAVEMIAVWIRNQAISINIQNGVICLQFYEVRIQTNFTYKLNTPL
jgi:hypothetical protein